MTGALGPALLLALYLLGVHRARRPWRLRRTVSFAAGCLALAAALAGPVESGSGDDLTAHMIQHLLLATAAPALLALGAPVRLALASLPPEGRRALGRALHQPVARALAHPAVATVLAAAVMLGVHLSGLFDYAERHPVIHALEHAALFWTAVLAWMAVLAVDPLPHRPGAVGVVAWLSITMIAMTGVGAVLASASTSRYAAYPSLSAQHDAGAIMWIGGTAVLVPLTIGLAMWALAQEEERQRRREAAFDAAALADGGRR